MREPLLRLPLSDTGGQSFSMCTCDPTLVQRRGVAITAEPGNAGSPTLLGCNFMVSYASYQHMGFSAVKCKAAVTGTDRLANQKSRLLQ